MIQVKAYKKDRKRKYWITLIIGPNRTHLSSLEAAELMVALELTLAFDRPKRIEALKGGK
jgi:hypothetical protein